MKVKNGNEVSLISFLYRIEGKNKRLVFLQVFYLLAYQLVGEVNHLSGSQECDSQTTTKTITFPQNLISAGLPARGDCPVRIVADLPASESSYVSNIVFSMLVVNDFLYLHLIALTCA